KNTFQNGKKHLTCSSQILTQEHDVFWWLSRLEEREMKGINPNTTMGIVEGSVWKIHPCHLSYPCPSFEGDSGGALILRSGEVIGIHVESTSQWGACTAADCSDPNFEDDLCDSVDLLSAGLAYGAIALRLQNII
ncbi:hypothetical protein PROFUN_16123, partial [Planoprotostelium fungivorum]